MKPLIYLFLAVTILLAGCATAPPAIVQPPGTDFRGEVWTWDERTNVVTLRIGTGYTRVRTTPETIQRLRLHEITTIRGEVAPPEEIPVIPATVRPMRAMPEGSPASAEVTGTVGAVDPRGLVSIDTPDGRLTVWTASTDTSAFPVGTPVRLAITVQPLRWVPVADGQTTEAAFAAPIPTGPGEHAVVTGRVLAINPKGFITVESPRGPIIVVTPGAASTPAGSSVLVRTSLQKAP